MADTNLILSFLKCEPSLVFSKWSVRYHSNLFSIASSLISPFPYSIEDPSPKHKQILFKHESTFGAYTMKNIKFEAFKFRCTPLHREKYAIAERI